MVLLIFTQVKKHIGFVILITKTLILKDVHHRVYYLISSLIIMKNAFFSEYKIQKTDTYCAAYCLCIIYLTKKLKIDFKSAVLHFYYKKKSQRKIGIDKCEICSH